MQQTRSFEFKNVLLLKLYVFPLIGAFVVGPIIVTIIFLLNSSLPVLIGATAIGFTVMFAIFKALSKTVTISFDNDHINFNYDNKTISYLKSELKGFYSFNHFRDATSTVSMCFEFNDGKKIDLSDYLATGKFIREKNEQLKLFVTMAERELGFSVIRINKARRFGKIGSTWFAKAVILILLPAFTFAQGVPKAYEAFQYKGILSGHTIKLSLADGYIGASYIISGKLKFQPESNSPDDQHHLKFLADHSKGYFILNNMQEAYGNTPQIITGKYYINNKVVPVKLNTQKK